MTSELTEEAAPLPSSADIDETERLLKGRIVRTPVFHWRSPSQQGVAPDCNVHFKFELFQRSGTFKIRGALSNALRLSPGQTASGVVAVSAGNHAIAVADAARDIGASAKTVMMKGADPYRIERVRALGGEVILAKDVHAAFSLADQIEREEGRAFIHPFDGLHTVLGSATLGREIVKQVPDLDAVIVPIGGGGLCAGVSAAIKAARPEIEVYGVEPEGADSMRRSFEQGAPASIDAVNTIADSLGAPHALPFSMSLCQQNVNELTIVNDHQLLDAMAVFYQEFKMAVEPAAVATTAALLGPLKSKLAGKRVCAIVCGSNIGLDRYRSFMGDRANNRDPADS
jgi:threonine dehydratase